MALFLWILDMSFISFHAKFQPSSSTIVNVAAHARIFRLGLIDASTLWFIMKLGALLGKGPCSAVRRESDRGQGKAISNGNNHQQYVAFSACDSCYCCKGSKRHQQSVQTSLNLFDEYGGFRCDSISRGIWMTKHYVCTFGPKVGGLFPLFI